VGPEVRGSEIPPLDPFSTGDTLYLLRIPCKYQPLHAEVAPFLGLRPNRTKPDKSDLPSGLWWLRVLGAQAESPPLQDSKESRKTMANNNLKTHLKPMFTPTRPDGKKGAPLDNLMPETFGITPKVCSPQAPNR